MEVQRLSIRRKWVRLPSGAPTNERKEERMIVKFKVNNGGFAYHEADEVIVGGERVNREDIKGTALMYSPQAKDKVASFRVRDNTLKTVYYSVGYLLNNNGDTINSL